MAASALALVTLLCSAGYAVSTPPLPPRCPDFCSKTVSASSYLQGPFQLHQTYLLFNQGGCVAEYTINWDNTTLTMRTAAEPVENYFGPSIKKFTGLQEVGRVYLTTDPSNEHYNLILLATTSSQTLQCANNPSVETRGVNCSSTVSTNGFVPAFNATAISSQLNMGDMLMYHYVIRGQTGDLSLVDANFRKTFQMTEKFLDGQSVIKTITAIQVLLDSANGKPSMMAVFGYGQLGKPSNSVAPNGNNPQGNAPTYVGFVQMPLDADPATPLTGGKWLKKPQQLKDIMPGCGK